MPSFLSTSLERQVSGLASAPTSRWWSGEGGNADLKMSAGRRQIDRRNESPDVHGIGLHHSDLDLLFFCGKMLSYNTRTQLLADIHVLIWEKASPAT